MGGVRLPNSTGETAEQRGETFGGGSGGKAAAKENIAQSNTQPTQRGERVSQGLSGVRRAAQERNKERFTALLHHVTLSLLRKSYEVLKKDAAPGVDGVTWREYETGLEDRLADLHNRVHRGAYRAQPSRRVYIRSLTEGNDRWYRGIGGQDRSTGRGDRSQ